MTKLAIPASISGAPHAIAVALVQTVSEKTFALIKPDALVKMGKIIETIETQFRITKMRMVRLSVQQAREFVAMNEQYSQQHAEVRICQWHCSSGHPLLYCEHTRQCSACSAWVVAGAAMQCGSPSALAHRVTTTVATVVWARGPRGLVYCE